MNFDNLNCDDVIDAEITRMFPIDDDTTRIEFVKARNMFKSEYARIKPFLLAYGRKCALYSLKLLENIDSIKWLHTDGVIFDKRITIDPHKEGDEIGKVRYEGKCKKASIVSCMHVFGKFSV